MNEDVDLDEVAETEAEQEFEPEQVKVAVVTAEDVKNKKYTIEQVRTTINKMRTGCSFNVGCYAPSRSQCYISHSWGDTKDERNDD